VHVIVFLVAVLPDAMTSDFSLNNYNANDDEPHSTPSKATSNGIHVVLSDGYCNNRISFTRHLSVTSIVVRENCRWYCIRAVLDAPLSSFVRSVAC
jgi:hypothetical protein